MPTVLSLAAIRLDDACQPRALTDLNLAGEYAQAMLQGAQFPPVVAFGDGSNGYWLADGYHRWHAASIAGLETIDCDVRPGGRREAILHSVGANAEHGWRRTTEDKRRAVMTLLNDPEWRQWSDREIGRRCGVTGPFVASNRPAPSANALQIGTERPVTRKVKRNGTVYEQYTAGIGRRREPEPAPEADYTYRDDPRQIDIEEVIPRFAYDAEAMQFCSEVCALIDKLNEADWPDPTSAMDAWMKDRSVGPSVGDVQFAADWMAEFAALYRIHEPRRQEAVAAMLTRAKELTNGTH